MAIYRIFSTDEQIKNNEIRTGYGFKINLKNFDKYKEDYSKFRDEYIEDFEEMTGNSSRISLGLALGKIWMFCNLKKGDYVVVVSLEEKEKMSLVEVVGKYKYDGENDWCHIQEVKKIKDIQRNGLTDDFKQFLGNRHSILAIPEKYYSEIPLEEQIKDSSAGKVDDISEAIAKGIKEAVDKKLNISFKVFSVLLLIVGIITFISHDKGMLWSFPLLLWIPTCAALWNMAILISKIDERIKHYIDGKED
ncbi:MAG: hypothetical protein LBR70_06670 [Lactobacillaceae bacterium]|jgi:hypothetical protein|nr:hypothetical protein [Lactobacillaceae bacterium]